MTKKMGVLWKTPASVLAQRSTIRQLPQTKTALGEFWSPLKKLQKYGGTKQLRITTPTREERWFYLVSITLSVQPALLSAKRKSQARASLNDPAFQGTAQNPTLVIASPD